MDAEHESRGRRGERRAVKGKRKQVDKYIRKPKKATLRKLEDQVSEIAFELEKILRELK